MARARGGESEKQTLLTRCAAKIHNRRLHGAWVSWQDLVADRRHAKKLGWKVLMRIVNSKLTSAMRSWVEVLTSLTMRLTSEITPRTIAVLIVLDTF